MNVVRATIVGLWCVLCLGGMHSRTFAASMTMPLAKGWNMVSFSVDPYDKSFSDLLADIAPRIGIVKDNAGKVYWPSYGINTIGAIDITQGYRINMRTAPDSNLIIHGAPIDPTITPIALNKGWNTIAFFPLKTTRLTDALKLVIPKLVMVKNSAGQVYWPQYNVDYIGYMYPGQGYRISMKESCVFLYGTDSVPVPPVTATRKSCTIRAGQVLLNGQPLPAGSTIIARTQNRRMAGSQIVTANNTCDLTVWGDDAATPEVDGMAPGEKIAFSFMLGTQEYALDFKASYLPLYQEGATLEGIFACISLLLPRTFQRYGLGKSASGEGRDTVDPSMGSFVGMGYDCYGNRLKSRCIENMAAKRSTMNAVEKTEFSLISSDTEMRNFLQSTFGVSASAQGWGMKLSGTVESIVRVSTGASSNSLTLIINKYVAGISAYCESGQFNQAAIDYYTTGNWMAYEGDYGNAYVARNHLGGYLFITYTANTASMSQEEYSSLKTAMNFKGRWLTGGLTANVSKENIDSMNMVMSNTTINSSFIHSGQYISSFYKIATPADFDSACLEWVRYYQDIMKNEKYYLLNSLCFEPAPYWELAGSGYKERANFPACYGVDKFSASCYVIKDSPPTYVTIGWDATCTVEDGYRIYGLQGNGATIDIATVGKDEQRYTWQYPYGTCPTRIYVEPFVQDKRGTCLVSCMTKGSIIQPRHYWWEFPWFD